MPPLHTYAILDAAKVTNLPELLEASGLEHRCMFKGAAFDDLKDAAPWIVRLEEGNAFTRHLFTRSEAPWHLWDAEPGIYLRARGALDEMWKHFRKFTRVQDSRGKWFYFRFWSSSFLSVLAAQNCKRSHTMRVIFNNMMVLEHQCERQWQVLAVQDPSVDIARSVALDSDLLLALNAEVTDRLVAAELKPVIAAKAKSASACAYDTKSLVALRHWLVDVGFTQTDQRDTLFRMLLKNNLLNGAPWPASLRDMLADTSRGAGVRLWLLENRTWN